MSQVDETQFNQVPIVVTQQDMNDQGIFNQTSKTLGWNQYFPESPTVEKQYFSSDDQQMFFIIKLYTFLASLFIIEYLMVIIFYYSNDFRWSLIEYNHYQYSFTPFYWVMLGFTVILGLAAYCIKESRKFPVNLIIYFLYTFGIGCVLAAPFAERLYKDNYSLIIILYQLSMTICTFGSLIASKFKNADYIDASWIVMLTIIIDVFMVIIFIMVYNEAVWLVIVSVLVHLLYAALLLFETRLIQKGKFKLRQNEYISGALFIYIEVTLFLFFLTIYFIIFLCVGFIILMMLIFNRKLRF